jgi:MFS family permease
VAFFVIATTTNYLLLCVAFMVYYPAAGAAAEQAQAVVIDAAPEESTRTMTRWTLLSGIGDFVAPLLAAGFVALHLGWTELCWLACALWLFAALVLAPLRFPAPGPVVSSWEETETRVWVSLRAALRDPLLLRWSALSIIPTMLDEVFLGFVALYLRDVWHLGEALIALILTLQMLASLLGLFLLERVLLRWKLAPVSLLTWLSLLTLVGVLGLLLVHVLWIVVAALLLINLSCAGWYPLAMAEAYACWPGSSGVVRAVINLGTPFDMALPGAVGLLAASFGILSGLGLFGLAPVLLLLLLPRRGSNKTRG